MLKECVCGDKRELCSSFAGVLVIEVEAGERGTSKGGVAYKILDGDST